MSVARPWAFRQLITMKELARLTCKPSEEAARKWVRRLEGTPDEIPIRRAGRRLLVDWRDVDALLIRDGQKSPRRRAS
jgi:hypothetical protein